MTAIKKYLTALRKGRVHFSVYGLNLKVQCYTSIAAVLRAVHYCGTDCFLCGHMVAIIPFPVCR